MHPSSKDVEREVRVALVLYGGVSLAIYENGVTRCFHQLVRGEGVFGLVLDLLRARATVDVIAGTSAGGINGLILAACLESGTDFKSTALLWRRLGDFGALLRPTRDADQAESLLKGETYYHNELFAAFTRLCKPHPEWQSPGEIDLFITGTDFDGHERRYQDGLGAEISDKQHRVVFHLKHRPGRTWLGLKDAKNDGDVRKQAAILASVARITSSFPVAFPPFRIAQLAEDGPAVAQALELLSQVPDMGRRSLVDGGVLDNKPFGPVMNAIFYRMPTMPVVRRLFYVEPDPVPFLEKYDLMQGAEQAPPPSHSPFEVAGASLTTIPAHEGIAADLERLIEHNQRLAWLRELQKDASSRAAAATDAPEEDTLYRRTRLESLARLLVLETDCAPSACDYPKDEGRRALLACLQQTLGGALKEDKNPLAVLDKFDVGFQQRIAFHLLYALYEAVGRDPNRDDLRSAMWSAGRIVKILEIVFVAMISIRKELVHDAMAEKVDGNAVWKIVDGFSRLLDVHAPHWASLLAELEKLAALEFESEEAERARQSLLLTKVRDEARAAGRQIHFHDMSAEQKLPAETILNRVFATLDRIAESCCGDTGDAFRLARWVALERALYPLEFSSGIHELDEIQFVRVSPADAQVGLSQHDVHKKVAGDELAHFSSFLRRDWRSNDLLYGRLDGICQILRSLLDDDSLLRAARRERARLGKLFDADRLREQLPNCPAAALEELAKAWAALVKETAELEAASGSGEPCDGGGEDWKGAADRFRTAFIVAGQEDTFRGDFEGVLADHYFQEIAYGRQKGPGGATSESTETAIEGDAHALARRDQDHGVDPWERFLGMGLGSQPVTGERAGLPSDVVGEYVTATYLLLWGLLKRSLGNHGGLLDRGRVRLFFRTPVAFFHHIFSLMRRDRNVALASLCVFLGALVGVGAVGFLLREWWLLGLAVVGALVVFWVLTPRTLSRPSKPSNPIRKTPRWPRFAALAVLALVGVAVWFGSDAFACLNGASDQPGGCAAIACSDCRPAMLALEFARRPEDITNVVGAAADPRRDAARRVLHVDFAFIAAYALLFVSVAVLLLRSPGILRKATAGFAIALVVVAALADVWENRLLLAALAGQIDEPMQISTAATYKWGAFFIALALVAFGFVRRGLLFACLAGAAWAAAARGLSALALRNETGIHPAFELAIVIGVILTAMLLAGSPIATAPASGENVRA